MFSKCYLLMIKLWNQSLKKNRMHFNLSIISMSMCHAVGSSDDILRGYQGPTTIHVLSSFWIYQINNPGIFVCRKRYIIKLKSLLELQQWQGWLFSQPDFVNYTLRKAYVRNVSATNYLLIFWKFNPTFTCKNRFWLFFWFRLRFGLRFWEYLFFFVSHLSVNITVRREHNVNGKCTCNKYLKRISPFIWLNWPFTWYLTGFPLSELDRINNIPR